MSLLRSRKFRTCKVSSTYRQLLGFGLQLIIFSKRIKKTYKGLYLSRQHYNRLIVYKKKNLHKALNDMSLLGSRKFRKCKVSPIYRQLLGFGLQLIIFFKRIKKTYKGLYLSSQHYNRLIVYKKKNLHKAFNGMSLLGSRKFRKCKVSPIYRQLLGFGLQLIIFF